MTGKQQTINNEVEAIEKRMMDEIPGTVSMKQLRSCQAWVYETDNFYILQSYNTVVACIDKKTDTCADFLREVYGYTATSAQHIAKFERDYGRYDRGCKRRLTWKD